MAQVVTTFVRYSPTYKKFKPIVCTGLTKFFFLETKKKSLVLVLERENAVSDIPEKGKNGKIHE